MRQEKLSHVNRRLAEIVTQDLLRNAIWRGGQSIKTIEAADIEDDKTFVPKTEEQIFKELDNYIGLQSVKDEIRAIVSNVKERREKGMTEKLLKDHFIFTGNPGTGKTTFARKFGEILNSIGALPTGQFIEVSAKEMIGNHVGDTELNVKATVDKAMGGVLFIDEAYAFASDDGNGFGMDAINTLLPILENRKGEFVCILAGYTKDMDKLVRMNEGIKSRCNVTIEFPDYQPRELEQLFRMMLTRNDEETTFTLDRKANEIALSELKGQFARQEIKTDSFHDDINKAAKYISFKLNSTARDQGQEKPMGCTLTGLVWFYGKTYLLNSGDSRTYRFRDGMLRQLTTDQTERGLTNNPEASKALLNCLGGGLEGMILVDDMTNKIIEDDVILICSDGLTDMLTDDEIESILSEGLTHDGMENNLAEKLKEKACEAGGYDNVSIVLAKL